MKRLMITFLSVLALVLVANTVFAQGSATSPFVGSTYTYTVTSLVNGDGADFFINDDPLDPTGEAGPYTIADEVNPVASTETSCEVTWNEGSAGNTYYLWVAITDQATGTCTNYRRITITPAANTLEFDIFAVGIDDDEDYSGTWTTDNNTSGCPVNVNKDYDYNDNDNDSSYVFYRVTRSGGSNDDSDWAFTFEDSLSAANSSRYVALHALVDSTGASWVTLASGQAAVEAFIEDGDGTEITVGSRTATPVDDILLRLTVLNTTNGATWNIGGNIGVTSNSSTAYEVDNDVPDSSFDQVNETFTINAQPDFTGGTFTGE